MSKNVFFNIFLINTKITAHLYVTRYTIIKLTITNGYFRGRTHMTTTTALQNRA